MEKILNPDTPIYRFFDFFALVDTFRNRRLRFSAPSTFPDKNEGLEIIYNSLRAAVESNDGSYAGITNQEDILRIHNSLKQSSFVCSWTRNADSIALWSLYSADRCGVRISSTVSKLNAAIDDFARNYSMQLQFNRFGLTDGASYAFIQGATAREVSYDNLRALHENILKKGQFSKVLADLEKKNVLEPFTLKDEAYIHEQEVRGIVICGSAIPSGSTGPYRFTDSAPWLDGDHVYVDIHDDFIDSVAIDPRCPRHKREIIEGYLHDHNISLSLSHAFGYLPDELDFATPGNTGEK
jgi:hypothetical protein